VTFELTGRRVLVTGAGQGIGRGIALAVAGAGAHVLVNDRDEGRAVAVVAEVEALGGSAGPCVFDVTRHDDVVDAVAAAGGVDVLVNNAGNAGTDTFAVASFTETGPDDWEPFLQVNLYGVMHCTRAVLPDMVERGWGRIITVVSDAGRTVQSGMAAYAAAKAGAAGLMRAVAGEVGRHGVTANSIALGTMRTPVSEAVWADPENPTAKALMRGYAIRRPGLPEDVAAMVLFLASDEASWATGQTYPVNGGSSAAL
jgi:NAD(P)-dependent dehydrogenase (short-subunit alcohol dehydrogenase family)